ncbi:UNVERIFIED_CONTAM: Arrestin domain-containing protein 3 [Gekko kuhli]
MGKVKSLTITLDCLGDSTVPVYSSGGTVSGRVQVEVAEEIGVKSLEIHARGRAKVRWSKSRRAGGDLASRRTYYREVEHFSHKAILMGHHTASDRQRLHGSL